MLVNHTTRKIHAIDLGKRPINVCLQQIYYITNNHFANINI